MKTYRIEIPNDFGSEEDSQKLAENYPELQGDDLTIAAFTGLHSQWAGLEMETITDFGGTFTCATPKPENLDTCLWVEEI